MKWINEEFLLIFFPEKKENQLSVYWSANLSVEYFSSFLLDILIIFLTVAIRLLIRQEQLWWIDSYFDQKRPSLKYSSDSWDFINPQRIGYADFA